MVLSSENSFNDIDSPHASDISPLGNVSVTCQGHYNWLNAHSIRLSLMVNKMDQKSVYFFVGDKGDLHHVSWKIKQSFHNS